MKNKFLLIAAGNIILMDWKGSETVQDISEGRKSYSKNLPVLVSYYPEEKKYLILDGHHRAIELLKDGKSRLECEVSEHQPKTYTIHYPFSTLKKYQ